MRAGYESCDFFPLFIITMPSIMMRKDLSLDVIQIPEYCSNSVTLSSFTGASSGESHLPVLVNGGGGGISEAT